ncbi:MAG: ribulose-phosphate 3-epimerase [Francisellaceae bacterium]|jgi:ribulose-phosphate 3-epimerase
MRTNEYWICPSILSADFARLGADVQRVIDSGANRIHVDVVDNHYVPNLTFGPMVVKALKKYGIQTAMDVHLMVEPVDDLIKGFAEAGASCIVFHPEASRHVDRSLQLIKSYNIDAGLALNPGTHISCLKYVMDKIDRVLLMSVNPGFGGQKLIKSVLTKAREIRSFVSEQGLNTRIEIDGGVTEGNIQEIASYGVDTFVAGSAIFTKPDYKKVIDNMRMSLSSGQ